MKRKLIPAENALNLLSVEFPAELTEHILSFVNILDLLVLIRTNASFNFLLTNQPELFYQKMLGVFPAFFNHLLLLYQDDHPYCDLSSLKTIQKIPWARYIHKFLQTVTFGSGLPIDSLKKLAVAIACHDENRFQRYQHQVLQSELKGEINWLHLPIFNEITFLMMGVEIANPIILSTWREFARQYFTFNMTDLHGNNWIHWLIYTKGSLIDFKTSSEEKPINLKKASELAIVHNQLDKLQYLLEEKKVRLVDDFELDNNLDESSLVHALVLACQNVYTEMIQYFSNYLLAENLIEKNHPLFYVMFHAALGMDQVTICKFLLQQGLVELSSFSELDDSVWAHGDVIAKLTWLEHEMVAICHGLNLIHILNIVMRQTYNWHRMPHINHLIDKIQGFSQASASPSPSPLFGAVARNYYEITKKLLDRGAMVNVDHKLTEHCALVAGWKFTPCPLWIAIQNGNLQLTRLLVDHHADFNHFGWTPLFLAAQHGWEELVSFYQNMGAAPINRLLFSKIFKENLFLNTVWASRENHILNIFLGFFNSRLVTFSMEYFNELENNNLYLNSTLQDLLLQTSLLTYCQFHFVEQEISHFSKNCNILPALELEVYLLQEKGDWVGAKYKEALITEIHSDLHRSPGEHKKAWQDKQKKSLSPLQALSHFSHQVPAYLAIDHLIDHAENCVRPQPEALLTRTELSSSCGFKLC